MHPMVVIPHTTFWTTVCLNRLYVVLNVENSSQCLRPLLAALFPLVASYALMIPLTAVRQLSDAGHIAKLLGYQIVLKLIRGN